MSSNVDSTLWNACEKNDEEVVRAMLFAKANPNARYGRFLESSLHRACIHAKPTIVEMLLKHNADPHQKSNNCQHSCFEYAIDSAQQSDTIKCVQLLINHNADVNKPNTWYGTNPLAQACGHKSVALVELLLNANASVNVKVGQIPLKASLGNTKIMKLLLEYKADPNECDHFLSYGANISPAYQNFQTPLRASIQCLYVDSVALMLQHPLIKCDQNDLDAAIYTQKMNSEHLKESAQIIEHLQNFNNNMGVVEPNQ